MNPSNKLLSDITAFRTYAKYIKHLERRESLEETINRDMTMHLERFPKFSRDIIKAFQRVHELKVMPSMRGLQFAGDAILKNHARQYNCSYAPINNSRSFGEAMFLLLSGVGFGFSVQKRHVGELPAIQKPREEGVFSVHDSIQGWAQSVDILMEAYFFGRIRPVFDFKKIRPKGSYLVTTGAKAPGPDPLKKALELVEEKLIAAIGRKLRPIEVHDIVCIISDAVLAGGIRRAALISLFDRNDSEMLKCKHGEWWNHAPWRARANNSAVLPRSEVTKEEFDHIFKMCKDSGSGEPGFSWTSDTDWGFNPCKPLYSTILTNEGYITFEQALQKNSLIVMGVDGKFKEASKPFKTGEQRNIYKITLSDGTNLYGTENHLHMTAEGEWKRLDELQINDKLKINTKAIYENTYVDNTREHESGTICGWVYGDGWFSSRTDHPGHTVGMCFGINEFDVVDYFSTLLDVEIKPHAQKPQTCMSFSSHKKSIAERLLQNGMTTDKTDLTWLYGKSKDFKLGFIKAVFTADGSVRKNNSVELYSTHKNSLEVISRILKEFGIFTSLTTHSNEKTYIAKDGKVRNNNICYKLNVYSGQFKKIGFLSKFKNNLLDTQIEKPIYRRKDYATIVDIDCEYDIQDVYDITVYDDSHAFIDSGVVTHNCHEIALNPHQFCNLTTINQTGITSEKDFLNRVYAAALIGTLQASYTDFHYLRPIWQQTTEKEALLGISFTGIADGNNTVDAALLRKGAQLVTEVNEKYAKKLGINLAARTTTIKPEGTSSCVLGSASGIHARHAPFYIRRIRMNKDDALAVYLKHAIPELVEDDVTSSSGVVVSIPQESPAGSIIRDQETALGLLDRALFYNKNWVNPGHREGVNKHNVSVTISVKEHEWDELREAMWENRKSYSGISLLPYDGGNYQQAPFEEISKEKYEEMNKLVKDLDLKQVKEEQDNTDRMGQLACVGGVCEIP